MDRDWLYYTLYPGDGALLDRVVREVVAPAVDHATTAGPPECWFFLRYTDDLGPHIRLRFGGRPAVVDAIRQAVDPVLRVALHDVTLTVTGGVTGCYPAFYEPEFDRYGGSVGVAEAEALFDTSSRTALALLTGADAAVTRRRALALALMGRAVRAALPPAEQPAFWERYEWHWSGGGRPTAAARRDRYRQQARTRAGAAAEQVAEVTGSPATGGLLDGYENALRALCGNTIPPERAAFHHVHLTNNRLGIPPSEEGYLARLMLELGTSG